MIQRRIKEPEIKELSFTIETVAGIGPTVTLGFSDALSTLLNEKPAVKKKLRRFSERFETPWWNRFDRGRRISTASASTVLDYQRSVMATKRYLAPMHFSSAENVHAAIQKVREREQKALNESANDVYAKNYVPKKYAKYSKEYGRPPPGSLTEMRAKKAAKHIAREILQLCEIIEEYGYMSRRTQKISITFGQLFEVYKFISDKVVGMLLRARKHQMVDFEGEMLYQRRDEDKGAVTTIGAAGGSTIISGVAGAAFRALWLDNTIKQAIDFPRLHNQLQPNFTQFEGNMPRRYIEALKQRGHTFKKENKITVVTAVQRMPNGTVFANSDWRKGTESEPSGY